MTARWGIVLILLVAGCSGGGEEPVIQALDAPSEQPSAPTPQPPVVTPPTVEPTPPPRTPTQPPPGVTPPAPVPDPLPFGVWHGQTKREGRSVLGVVQEDGKAWFITSVVGAPDWAGGVVTGTVTADGSTWKLDKGLYVNWEHQSRASLTASGTWLKEQRLLGEFRLQYDPPSTGPPLFETDGMDLIYDTRSKEAFDLKQAAGVYLGLWIPLQEVSIELKADGTILGRTTLGCTFSGTATPNGPVADAEVTFDGPPCVSDHAAVRGVLGVDRQAGKLYAAGFSTDRNQGYVFIGQR